LQLLLDRGFDVDAQDWAGRTPLMYAAASGSIDVAVSLLRSGADPWLKHNLYGRQGFIHYAVRSSHWQFVIAVMDFVRQSSMFSTDDIRSLLNLCIVLWAGESPDKRTSGHFSNLLNWGADPDILFTDHLEGRRVSDHTLLHNITNSIDFETLMRSGFTRFNHPNSTGAHPLMTLAELCDPKIMAMCINRGCNVNHQDLTGRTSLSVVVEEMWKSLIGSGANFWITFPSSLESVQMLLNKGADPLLSDFCQCACSRQGCTPSNFILKDLCRVESVLKEYDLSQYLGSLEWLQLLRVHKGLETANAALLDMIRMSRFEELELTHTCCRKHWSREPWQLLDDDEVDEIMDEEQEIIQGLEKELAAMQSSINESPEEFWLKALPSLLRTRARRYRSMCHDPRDFLSLVRLYQRNVGFLSNLILPFISAQLEISQINMV
jgi:ankyrin repeat protein